MSVARLVWRVLVAVVLVVCLAGRGLAWLGRVAGFLAEPVDELVAAWLGIAPVLPRARRWHHRLVAEWRAHRSGVVEAEVVVNGVWR
jgi:hypothetical protein